MTLKEWNLEKAAEFLVLAQLSLWKHFVFLVVLLSWLSTKLFNFQKNNIAFVFESGKKKSSPWFFGSRVWALKDTGTITAPPLPSTLLTTKQCTLTKVQWCRPVISTCYLWPHNKTVSKIQQKQLSKTNWPINQKPTSETREKTNKNPWMWGKNLYNRGDDREGKKE